MTKRKTLPQNSPGLFDESILKPDQFKMRARSFAVEDLILPNEEVRASAQFRQSVKNYGGIFEPIVVQFVEDEGKYRIIEGRRRFWTLYDLVNTGELSDKIKIPAAEIIGVPLDLPFEVVQACVSLMLNHLRGENIVADANSLRLLVSQGATEFDIKALTGMSDQTLKRTLRFNNLIKPLREALEEGRFTSNLAERISKLSKDGQKKLADTLRDRLASAPDAKAREKVRLGADDLREVKSVRSRAAVAAMPGNLFGDDAENAPAPSPYRFHQTQIERLRATLPQTAPARLRSLFEKLEGELKKVSAG